MPTDAVIGQAINFEELRQAFADAPKETARFVKTPLFRFAKRVAKRVKVESLSGRPGIKGGPWRRLKDKNVQGFVTGGNDLGSMKAVNKVSRILRTHVEGVTITAKAGGFLFLSRKNGFKTGSVFARVKSVTIPARVKFEEPWKQEIPKVAAQIADAVHRAVSVALDRRMQAIGSVVQRLTSV